MGLKLNFAWNRHSNRVERKEEVEGADFRRGLVLACVVHGMLEVSSTSGQLLQCGSPAYPADLLRVERWA